MKTISPSENSFPDGHLRIERIPQLSGLFLRRLLKRGQHYSLIPEGTPAVLPKMIPPTDRNDPLYENVQFMSDGCGPLFFKRYSLEVSNPKKSGLDLMKMAQADPNAFAPSALAKYVKTKGVEGQMKKGDEYFIEMTGPWNGPVRAIEVTPLAFHFLTLNGHMEAGQIRFEVFPNAHDSGFRFEIRSWARSRDGAVDFIYDTLKAGQLMQAEMWTSFLENAAKKSGGKAAKKTEIETQRNELTAYDGM